MRPLSKKRGRVVGRDHTTKKHVRTYVWALASAGLLSVVDLSAKWAMVTIVMAPPRSIPVLPFFDLVLVFNRGVSFGMLSDLGAWGPSILSGVAMGIVSMMCVWLWHASRRIDVVAITLIIGGAIGNLIDRLHDEAVTDFLSLYAGPYHWPAFNGADVFIVTGVSFLLLSNLRSDPAPPRESLQTMKMDQSKKEN